MKNTATTHYVLDGSFAVRSLDLAKCQAITWSVEQRRDVQIESAAGKLVALYRNGLKVRQ
jgi:hypothetical protein